MMQLCDGFLGLPDSSLSTAGMNGFMCSYFLDREFFLWWGCFLIQIIGSAYHRCRVGSRGSGWWRTERRKRRKTELRLVHTKRKILAE
ncbi:uncharacterized protein BO72DRAFT_280817 [Aspergillus fijiensis CBS 313.89]|uniref:Uncharacterized protein n=1 Tax=Aspergillus fijiensis CBS 313.89 TaxID=1448319 RepID=A0A8G1RZ95_9EURO|nr:uncharacterized protein BO72DRAFT_280817 [Aspergillus fijiensis CBS 313.89]RAK80485.1 hypothetical protein BO72DRAFT_280817 [Aspergillus fijiensis CBS 313.89]